ncbi:hypothetical protein B5C34_08725 [Pacificimonas flava]|uniref:Uncharacterized protein n=2 Tax=Pacificimonas TaxID=1960290 RepID=A0A219B583_9SPHN|nr:hypothetical protein [Pacificimonas flava]MBZ6379251.1 hypothetical protein [Pacificimonas aurantium]OWV33535.1 hypothetical protein B5C34_08725 [Pacificimonas flava]
MSVLVRIDRVMRKTGMSATRIGREAVNDPRLVFDLRGGRTLRPQTERRVNAYLESRLGGTL